jgi:geranylgeranyl diphosphate synthase type I
VLANQHVVAGRPGDPARFGAAAGVLAGDLLLVWADQLLSTAALSPRTLIDARRRYDQMRVEAIAGQYLDILGETDAEHWSVQRALHVARLKTASYTVYGPLLFGTTLSGRPVDPRVAVAYRVYGVAVGGGVPAPRRSAGRLRRPGGHRQAGWGRPAQRRADGVAADR